MHVVAAPDKFAGSLTASEAAAAVADGWHRVRPGDTVDELPLSDGGPGFLAVLHAALGGRWVETEVVGPLGAPARAQVLVVDQDGTRTAYVESAQACGLALVGAPSPTTALDATTTGVGELLLAALHEGVARVVVGVGGTAATDGGRGCVERLGGGWPASIELVVATDVRAPLLGPGGAATVFGPQKGAGPDTVQALEHRLAAWVAGRDGPAVAEGAGAGGGLGYGLLLLGAVMSRGTDTVIRAVGLRERTLAADLVVTGEGRFDGSSLLGKVPAGVAAVARDAGLRCVVLAGDRAENAPSGPELAAAGIAEVRTLVDAFGRNAALAEPATRLADLAATLGAEQR